jgi:twitching motility protein PilJ
VTNEQPTTNNQQPKKSKIIMTNTNNTNKSVQQDSLEEINNLANNGQSLSKQNLIIETETSPLEKLKKFSWNKLSLKTKATFVGILLSVVPVIAMSAIDYGIVKEDLTKSITETKKNEVASVAKAINRFLFERYGDIQVLSNLAILANPSVRQSVSLTEKQAILEGYIKAYKVYDSITIFDIQGNSIVQAGGKAVGNHSDRDYFQAALTTGRPYVSQPIFSQSTRQIALYLAAPVKDRVTGKTIAIVRTRMPLDILRQFQQFITSSSELHFVDAAGKFFVTPEGEEDLVEKPVAEDLPTFAELFKANKTDVEFVKDRNNKEKLVGYTVLEKFQDLPNPNWVVLASADANEVLRAERQLLQSSILGTLLAALVAGALATYLINRATRPILESAETVKKIGRGDLAARISVAGEDEVATLGSNINLMADQIQELLTKQTTEAEKERLENAARQQELLRLLTDVEGASEGDLTVRAEINAGEIGIVADFFNAIVESLREIVNQVKQSATQVNLSLGKDEEAILVLANQSKKQAKKIERSLEFMEKMVNSIEEVAANARSAAEVSRTASSTAETGGAVMEKTVDSILQLRETVAETAKKVKRLGESSQQISKVISLINQIALQTNLLAINASIEAARAGEEGRGFAVVAEEVGQLAAQSAAATKEIEKIVESIQQETSEVVGAMEIGTAQVVEGTRLVEETKQSLSKIVEVSRQVDELLQFISTATVSQTETSQMFTQVIKDIARTSEQTSESSKEVSNSLEETVAIARQLEESVARFKVSA